jgi:hypothetical protein
MVDFHPLYHRYDRVKLLTVFDVSVPKQDKHHAVSGGVIFVLHITASQLKFYPWRSPSHGQYVTRSRYYQTRFSHIAL